MAPGVGQPGRGLRGLPGPFDVLKVGRPCRHDGARDDAKGREVLRSRFEVRQKHHDGSGVWRRELIGEPGVGP